MSTKTDHNTEPRCTRHQPCTHPSHTPGYAFLGQIGYLVIGSVIFGLPVWLGVNTVANWTNAFGTVTYGGGICLAAGLMTLITIVRSK